MQIQVQSIKRQSGVVLLVCLMMLLLLTFIAMTGAQVTSYEEKMAGNMRDRNMAFQAAEAAIVAGEAVATTLPFNCTNGRYKAFDADCNGTLETAPVWESINWSPTANPPKTVQFTDGTLSNIPVNPRYIIETLPGFRCSIPASATCTGAGEIKYYHYRITARAEGATNESVVILQSVFESQTPPT